MMKQRINERIAIGAIEVLIDDLDELNSMMRDVIASISSARESLASLRNTFANGEDND